MPSSDVPRRRLLAAGTGCLSALIAGCTGTDATESQAHDHAVDEGVAFESDEYDHLAIRTDDDERFVFPRDDPPDDPSDDDRPRRRSIEFVLDEDDAEALEIDADDEAAARSFLDETDFDDQSVVVEQRSIEDCYRRHVLAVRADPDRFRTRYCRTLKPPTAACEADVEVMEAQFFRIRYVYEEPPSGRSSGERASCSEEAVIDEKRDDGAENATDAKPDRRDDADESADDGGEP
ncbi:hypothetical protein [Natrarchaeobius oligotrophus]|uniref:Uncharacterized protein n=1 Tax=Natrarchaeobius chitinivorans TaxID=1679083 RepID=A0A3N6M2I4_NATCH|nr:hypothetical protein [Natrarchaeobius chitinivorans]RQG97618.1 hypothetical protein EA472_18950 [Natrarchaeobius chitinivorans]